MYSIGHKQMKLDGVITEFADIYSPIAQLWKEESLLEKKKLQLNWGHLTVNIL